MENKMKIGINLTVFLDKKLHSEVPKLQKTSLVLNLNSSSVSCTKGSHVPVLNGPSPREIGLRASTFLLQNTATAPLFLLFYWIKAVVLVQVAWQELPVWHGSCTVTAVSDFWFVRSQMWKLEEQVSESVLKACSVVALSSSDVSGTWTLSGLLSVPCDLMLLGETNGFLNFIV